MKKAYLLVILVVVVSVTLALLYYVGYRSTHITTDNAVVEGTIYVVSSKVPGTVKAVYVEENRFVRKGDLLLEIDEKDFDTKVREAEAACEVERRRLSEAEESLKVLERKLYEIEAAIRAEKAQRDAQRYMVEQARLDRERAENLFQKDALSKERYEKAITAFKVQESSLSAMEERIRQLEVSREAHLSQIEQVRKTLQTQRSVLSLRKATLEDVLLKRSYTKVYAPSDGYVTKKSVEVGNVVGPSQPLLAVVPLSDIWVVANYKETQIKRIKPGLRVRIKVDAYPSLTFFGTVDSIQAGTGSTFSLFPPENATGNWVKVVQRIPVRIRLDEEAKGKGLLRIGMSCEATVLVE
jgi:membrane fusion protein (multidrug efflux system)